MHRIIEFFVLMALSAILGLATTVVRGGTPPQAPRPPQAPYVHLDKQPDPDCGCSESGGACKCKGTKRGGICKCGKQRWFQGACSSACTCGCNEGLPCVCGISSQRDRGEEESEAVVRPAIVLGTPSGRLDFIDCVPGQSCYRPAVTYHYVQPAPTYHVQPMQCGPFGCQPMTYQAPPTYFAPPVYSQCGPGGCQPSQSYGRWRRR